MRNTTYTVKTTAQEVLPPGLYGAMLQADPANTVNIYLGMAYVTADSTATGGVVLVPGAALPIEMDGATEWLWAICASGAPVLHVLVSEPVNLTTIGT